MKDEVFQFLQEHSEIFPNEYITKAYRNLLQADFTIFRETLYKMHCKITAWQEPSNPTSTQQLKSRGLFSHKPV